MLLAHPSRDEPGAIRRTGRLHSSVADTTSRPKAASARERLATVEHARLTPAQRRVLRALRQGGTHQDVADRLSRKLSTVRGHIKRIHGKTDTHSPAQLMLFIVEHWECCIDLDDD